ncbi:MAG: carbohydrate ABC transporter permease [Chloroflexi bacterium]|nr:carbohydrate ABC transporter permease [Chloroflexota bacterium]
MSSVTGARAREAAHRRPWFPWKSVLAHAVLTAGAITMLIPFLWMLHTSTMPVDQAYKYPPILFPTRRAWENYTIALSLLPFGRFYLNSAQVSTLITIAQLLTCSLGAFSFARLRYPGRDAIFVLYLATMMVPFEVTLIPNFVIIRTLGWIDTYLALIAPFAFSAYGTFLLRQYFKTIPSDLDDAARIDGAGYLTVYWRIFMPLSTPALATLGIFVFLFSWNTLLWPLVVTNSMDMRTVPVGLAMFIGRDQMVQWHLLMAATAAATVPSLIVFLAGQKYFVRGITLTGIKG